KPMAALRGVAVGVAAERGLDRGAEIHAESAANPILNARRRRLAIGRAFGQILERRDLVLDLADARESRHDKHNFEHQTPSARSRMPSAIVTLGKASTVERGDALMTVIPQPLS